MNVKFDAGTGTLTLSGRIDSNNAGEVEKKISEELSGFSGEPPVIDAEGLEYISSAGLRVLLKFCKMFSTKLNIINVSNNVYDIFEVTGFNELLKVRKKFREISVDGLPVIGGGISSIVYRIDPDTIVKVFNNAHRVYTLSMIEDDQRISREVFLHDIPTAIPFDVVKVGNFYGIVYEMIDADTMSGVLRKNPERLNELSVKAAHLLKKLHTTEFDEGTFADARFYPHKMAEAVYKRELISSEDKKAIDELIDRIPYRNTFIHSDFHPNNLLVRGDELILIDVGEAGQGNPIIDLFISYGHFVYLSGLSSRNGDHFHERILGLSAEMLHASWDIILPEYFGTSDRELLRKYEKIISDYSSIINMTVLRANAAGRSQDELKKVINEIMTPFCESIPTLKPIEGI